MAGKAIQRERLMLSVTPELKERIRAAAERAGKSMAGWMRNALSVAADQQQHVTVEWPPTRWQMMEAEMERLGWSEETHCGMSLRAISAIVANCIKYDAARLMDHTSLTACRGIGTVIAREIMEVARPVVDNASEEEE